MLTSFASIHLPLPYGTEEALSFSKVSYALTSHQL
jgi:hypothetical protein